MATLSRLGRRRMAWALVAFCGMGVACTLFVRAEEAAKDLVVWDGDAKVAGGGWAGPKVDSNFIKPNEKENHGGKKSLEFHGEGAEWIGAGWNWCSWWPADGGTNISTADRLSFWVKLTGESKPADFTVHLGSSNKKATPDVNFSSYVKDGKSFTDGEWHQIIIPLKELYGEKTEFDPKCAWEIQFGEWSQDAQKFSLFIDQIQFLTPGQK